MQLFTDLGPLKKNTRLKELPTTPETGWRPPVSFPNLSNAVAISIDVETKETDWDHGPGWARGYSNLVGFSVGARDSLGNRGAWYFPIRHEVEPEYNLDPEQCIRWLKFQLEHATNIVGANLLYDLGNLTDYGIYPSGNLYDVQFGEALLSEDGDVNLEHLAVKYLGEHKESTLLYEWLARAYGGKPNGDQRGNIYRASPRLVGPYGEADADLPMRVMDKLAPALQQTTIGNNWQPKCRLWDVFRMECDLIPLLIEMRRAGQFVNIPQAEKLYAEITEETNGLEKQLNDGAGFLVNVDSGKDLEKLFNVYGIDFPRTEIKINAQGKETGGNGSFKKEFLKSLDHPAIKLVLDIRERRKITGTFLKSYLLERNRNGFIHCSFHPLRADDGGTRSGRFASSDPNLQNIPVRSDLGKKLRTAFTHDPGHARSFKGDYSQIEYRSLAHFAVGTGADRLREEYNTNPKTDYHNNTHDRLCPFMGWDPLDDTLRDAYRKPIKNINFGLLYGMGKGKLSRSLMQYFAQGVSRDKIDALFNGYHSGNPYVQETMNAAAQEAADNGFVETILGRRSYFDMWEPVRERGDNNRQMPLPLELALERYGQNIQRAHLHKAINRKLQGSAADVIKFAMLKNWKDGVYKVIGVPRLQVHDELVHSVMDESREQMEAYNYMVWNMENAIRMRVPIVFDYGFGSNWGDCKG
jgi:DNA polymerase-1